MSVKNKLLSKTKKNKEQSDYEEEPEEGIGNDGLVESRITSLRKFISSIGLDWKKMSRRQINKISGTAQYQQWLDLKKTKKLVDEDPNLSEENLDEFHRPHRPHMRPTEMPRLDVGQVRPTPITRQPETTYTQVARQVINRGGTVTRSPGAITFKGRKGLRAYKATKHAQLSLGRKRLTLQPHKGVAVHGKIARKLSSQFRDDYVPNNDVVISEIDHATTMKASDAHSLLLQHGFIEKKGKKHTKMFHPKTKATIPISRTGNLSSGVTASVRREINRAKMVMEEEKNNMVSVSKKTQKVIDKNKQISSKDNKFMQKQDDDKNDEIFVIKKTMTGMSGNTSNNYTNTIEINPKLEMPRTLSNQTDDK